MGKFVLLLGFFFCGYDSAACQESIHHKMESNIKINEMIVTPFVNRVTLSLGSPGVRLHVTSIVVINYKQHE